MNIGVIIARFQTPFLHKGHIHLIDEIKKTHNRLIIILGISPLSSSRNNPFDYTTREGMIKDQYPDIIILPLADHPDDRQWSKNLDQLLEGTFPSATFTLFGSRDSFIPAYSGKYNTTQLQKHGDFSSTEIRKKYADQVGKSEDFRKGVLYAVHCQYKKAYPTVDIAVFRNNKSELLLGRKAISNRWRFIGGFVDPEDQCLEVAAKRELNEEAGAIETSPLLYEMSAKIDDWRYRNESDKIITSFFSCDYIFGAPKANDDIKELQWVKVSELNDMMDRNLLSEEHGGLFRHVIKKYVQNV